MAQGPTPPGFSLPSREPPPGFPACERTEQGYLSNSGKHSLLCIIVLLLKSGMLTHRIDCAMIPLYSQELTWSRLLHFRKLTIELHQQGIVVTTVKQT